MADADSQLDTRIEIVTPENIAFHYHIAGPFRRGIAYLVDWVIRAVVVVVLGLAIMIPFGIVGLGGIGAGLWLILLFAVDWFYGGLFETFMNGQTPGKRLLRLRVVTDEGQPVNGWQAVLRNVLRAVDLMPVLGVVLPLGQLGLLKMALNRRSQRFGDRIAGTMVVIEDPAENYGVQRIVEGAAIQLASELPANFQASKELAKALSAYVARRHMFSPARRIEIARHAAEPLRVKLDLPASISYDLLLCALYHRVFIAEKSADLAAARMPPITQPPPVLPWGQQQTIPPWMAAGQGVYTQTYGGSP